MRPAPAILPRCAGPPAGCVRGARERRRGRFGAPAGAVANADTRCRSLRGTIFQDSHLPLTTWFRAMWHVTSQKNGISALGFGIPRLAGDGGKHLPHVLPLTL